MDGTKRSFRASLPQARRWGIPRDDLSEGYGAAALTIGLAAIVEEPRVDLGCAASPPTPPRSNHLFELARGAAAPYMPSSHPGVDAPGIDRGGGRVGSGGTRHRGRGGRVGSERLKNSSRMFGWKRCVLMASHRSARRQGSPSSSRGHPAYARQEQRTSSGCVRRPARREEEVGSRTEHSRGEGAGWVNSMRFWTAQASDRGTGRQSCARRLRGRAPLLEGTPPVRQGDL